MTTPEIFSAIAAYELALDSVGVGTDVKKTVQNVIRRFTNEQCFALSEYIAVKERLNLEQQEGGK